MFKIRKAEVLAALVVLAIVGLVFAGGYMLGDDAALADLRQATDTATEAQQITEDAVVAAAMAEDEVAGLRATITELEASNAEQAQQITDLTDAITAQGYEVTITAEGDTSITAPATITPQAYVPAVAPVPTKATKVAAYKAAQAALAPPAPAMTWPTHPFATKAQCDAHYRARMEYWLKVYGVNHSHNLYHSLNVIWSESGGDCDAYNATGGYVGLGQFSPAWVASGPDWRRNGDTNLRRIAKAIADGGHGAWVRHWGATCGSCL